MRIPITILFLLCIFMLLPQIGASENDTLKAEAFYQEGKRLYYDGEYNSARAPFLQALEQYQNIHGNEHEDIVWTLLRLGKNERRLRNHRKALSYYFDGLEMAKKVFGESDESVGTYFLEIGNCYSQMFDEKTAASYYNRSIEINRKLYGAESEEVGTLIMQLALSDIKGGRYRSGEQRLEASHRILAKTTDPNSKMMYRIYQNKSYLYRKTGNYDRCIEFGKKALEIKLMHYDQYHPSVSKYYGNLSRAYEGKGDYETALSYMEKAHEISSKSYGDDHPETAGTLGMVGSLQAFLGKPELAVRMIKEAVKVQEQRLSLTHPYVVAGYCNIGDIYHDEGEYEKALVFYRDALAKFESHKNIPGHILAEMHRRIANIYLQQSEYKEALQSIGKATQYLAPDFTPVSADLNENPPLELIQNNGEMLTVLEAKSQILEKHYDQSRKQEHLKDALATSEMAINLIEKIRRSYQTESDRTLLNANTTLIFHRAVKQAFLLFQLTDDERYLLKAFQFSEKSKASILIQNLNENFAMESSGIPEAFQKELYERSRSIAEKEQQITDEDLSAEARAQLSSQVFDEKRAYEQEIKRIESINPDYYNLKYPSGQLDMDELSLKLSADNNILIEYYLDDSDLYTFLVTEEGLSGLKSSISFDLDSTIRFLNPYQNKRISFDEATNHQYMDHLVQLYRLLISPIEEQITASKNLVIIPHGVLGYLSFEMLIPENGSDDFRQLDYLIRNHELQYDWSASLWMRETVTNEEPIYAFAGFAPDFGNGNATGDEMVGLGYRENVGALQYSQPEILGANAYFPGRTFIADEASESEFLEVAPGSGIIHLATHAIVDNEYPMQSGLLFSNNKDQQEDGFLDAKEIYTLKLVADLAVMSACNTGYGKLAEGEGIMSLGRAFLYAGCKSIVMSLWLANDVSTSEIMKQFYKHLSQGQSKHVALRKAKLAYLNKTTDPLAAHPYFWANMIAVGDMSPLSHKLSLANWLMIFGGILLAGMVSWLLVRTN